MICFPSIEFPCIFILSRGGLQISANEPVKEQVWHMAMTILESPYSLGRPVTVKGNLGVTASLVTVPSPHFEDGCSCSHCTFPHLRKRIRLHSINIFGPPQPGHVERLWAYRAHIRFDQIRSATLAFLMEACHGHLNYSLIAVSTRHGLC